MNIKQNLANSANYGGVRQSIKYIVIHYTGNDGDTDEANANYFKNNIVPPSFPNLQSYDLLHLFFLLLLAFFLQNYYVL